MMGYIRDFRYSKAFTCTLYIYEQTTYSLSFFFFMTEKSEYDDLLQKD